jgi:PKD repeat protein
MIHCSPSFRRIAGGLAWLLAIISSQAIAQPTLPVDLPSPVRGEAAVAALGAHLPSVATAYGLDAGSLATLFRAQAALGVDRKGHLFFACDGLAVSSATKVGASLIPGSSTVQIASGTNVDAFALHSFPGASRVIYLDFNGHTTSGTQWNSSMTGGAPIVSQPFDLDGSPSTFNATERAIIQGIWQRVAEDYAPFAIDVTTQDPGVEALRRTDSNDVAYGVRVVISPTNWYNSGAGGVGYIGSFNWNVDTPCFAFTAQLANGEKYIAECASHEAGHTLGLYHDGANGTEYYAGQGNWAPIMGVGYYKTLTQFSKGEYSGATNTQDDFAVVAKYAPIAGDDCSNTLAAAQPLTGPILADGGTIETRTDVDVFRFDTAAGAIAINVRSPSPEANLHAKVELLNSAGQVIAANDPSALTAAFNLNVAAGVYYLRVSGAGWGDPSSTGYSNYGSVGSYLITGSILATTTTKQAPVAALTATPTSGYAPLTVSFSGAGSTDVDGTISSYAWDFGDGTTGSGVSVSHTYQNTGSYTATLTVTDSDGLKATTSIGITAASWTSTNVAPIAVAAADVTSGTAPIDVHFSAAGSRDSDGTIVSYAWDFGDGMTGSGQAVTKTYSVAGTFTARVVVTDNAGASSSATVTVTVAKRSKRRN